MAMTPAAKDPNSFASSNLSGGNSATGAILGIPQDPNTPRGPQPTAPPQGMPGGVPNFFASASGGQSPQPQGLQVPGMDQYNQVTAQNQQVIAQMFQPKADEAPQYGLGPNGELQVGDQVVPMQDNPTMAAQLLQSPAAQQSTTNLRPGFQPIDSRDVQGYLSGIQRGIGSSLYQGGKEFVSRAPGAALGMVADAAKWAGLEGVGGALQSATDWTNKATGADQPVDTLNRGTVGKWFVNSAADASQMLPIIAASMAIPEMAIPRALAYLGDAALNFGLFGSQAAQQKKESLLAQGASPEQANQAGWVDFFTQGGGMMAMGLAGKAASSGTYGAAQQVVSKLQQAVGKGAMTAEDAAAAVTNPALLARFAANQAGNIGVQGAAMGAMSGASAASNNAYGGQNQDIGSAVAHGVGAGLSLGALMSPLGLAHQLGDSARRRQMGAALSDPTQPVDLIRATAMEQAAKQAQPEVASLAGAAPAQKWMEGQQVRSDKLLGDANQQRFAAQRAAETAPPPVAEVPPTTPTTPAAPAADQELASIKLDDTLKAVGIGKKNKAARTLAEQAVGAGIDLESAEAETLVKALKKGKLAAATAEVERLKGAKNGATGPADAGVPPSGPAGPTDGAGGVGIGEPVAAAGQAGERVADTTTAPAVSGEPPMAHGAGVPEAPVKPQIPDFSLEHTSGEPSKAWQEAHPEPIEHAPLQTQNLSLRNQKETGQAPLFEPEVARKKLVKPAGETAAYVAPEAALEKPKSTITAEQAWNRLKRGGVPKYADLSPEARAIADEAHAKGELTQENWDKGLSTSKNVEAKQSKKRQEVETATEAAKSPEQRAAEAEKEAAEKTTIVPESEWVKAFGKIHGPRIFRRVNGMEFKQIAEETKTGEKAWSEDAMRKSVDRATDESIAEAVKSGKVDALVGADMKRQLEKGQKGTVEVKTAAEVAKEGGDSTAFNTDVDEHQAADLVSQEGIDVRGGEKMGTKSRSEKAAEKEQAKAIAAGEPPSVENDTGRGGALSHSEEALVEKSKEIEAEMNAALKAGDKNKASDLRQQLKDLATSMSKAKEKRLAKEQSAEAAPEHDLELKLAALNDQLMDAESSGDSKRIQRVQDAIDAVKAKMEQEGSTQEADFERDTKGNMLDESQDPTESAHVGTAAPDADTAKIDSDLRKIKDFGEVIKYAIGNEANKFRKNILTNVLSRYEQLKKLGFEFDFSVTPEGRQINGSAIGISRHIPGIIGAASRVEVLLNGAHMGDRAGTTQETLAHELIHSVTQAMINANPEGTAARKLQSFYSELRKDILARKAAGTLNDYEQSFFKGANNSLENANELLAWGLTNGKMQNYLASRIDPNGKSWFHRLLDVVANALGIHKVDERSDLARLIATSDELFHEDLTPYVKDANAAYNSFGRQEHVGTNSAFALRNKGMGEIAYDKDGLVLIKTKSIGGKEIFVPGKDGVGMAKVDIGSYTGRDISAADVAKLRSIADGMRTKESAMVQKNISKLPERLQEPARTVADVADRWMNSGLDRLVFTKDLVERGVTRGMTALTHYSELLESRNARAGHFQKMAYDAIEDVRKFSDPEKRALSDFLQHSTLEGEWGYGPKATGKAKKMFDAMSPRSQQVAKDIFKHGDEILGAKKDAIKQLAGSLYDDMLKGTTGTDRESIIAERDGFLRKYNTLMKIGEGTPYTSARRHGDWIAVGKSPEFLAAEKAAYADGATAADRKAFNDLITDPKHHLVSEAQNEQEAKMLRQNMRDAGFPATGEHTYYKPKEDWEAELNGGKGVVAGMARLRNQLQKLKDESSDVNQKTKYDSSIRLLTNMWLDALSQSSARKSELRRLGVHGTMDMVGAFREQSGSDAHFIAGIEHNDRMLTALKQAYKQADRGEGEDRTTKLNIYSEFMKRHEQGVTNPPTPWANKITKTVALWQIATSPAHYVGNLMQPWTMTLPMLAAKHGYGTATSEFFKAYKEIGGILANTGLLKSLKVDDMPADVRVAMKRLLELGRLDIGMNTEYTSMDLNLTPKSMVSKAMANAADRVTQASLKMESLNRLASAAAAYRLELKRNGGDHEKALHYAGDVVAETHGDHSRANAPRAFNSGFGKVALQFRKFQLVQLTQMAKMIGNLKNADSDERALALRTLTYTLAHVGALGGAIGMPGFNTMSSASSAIQKALTGVAGEDWETKIAKMVGDPHVAQLLLRGLPGLAGVDLTSKVGYGDMLGIAPYTDVDITDRQSVEDAIGQVTAGPFGGLMGRAAQSLHHLMVGNYYKGIEGLMPQGISNVLKGAREGGFVPGVQGGVTNTKGDKLMDLNAGEAMLQAMGFAPSSKAEMQSETGAMIKSTEDFKNRLELMKESYVTTVRSGGDVSSAVKNMNELRAQMVERGFKPTPLGDMLKAPTQQLIREIFTTPGGLQYKPGQTQRAVEQFPK